MPFINPKINELHPGRNFIIVKETRDQPSCPHQAVMWADIQISPLLPLAGGARYLYRINICEVCDNPDGRITTTISDVLRGTEQIEEPLTDAVQHRYS